MAFVSVAEMAKTWGVSARSVRNYCAQGRVPGAFLAGKTWLLPENAEKPARSNRKSPPRTLLARLQAEKASKFPGGIYHKTQIDLTYNSNHIEGSRLTREQTRYIFETNTIGIANEVLNVDDVVETANHFRCVDLVIDHAAAPLTEPFLKNLHLVLKNGTSDSRQDWFAVGDYKKFPNEVGGRPTTPPEEVAPPNARLAGGVPCPGRKDLGGPAGFSRAIRAHPPVPGWQRPRRPPAAVQRMPALRHRPLPDRRGPEALLLPRSPRVGPRARLPSPTPASPPRTATKPPWTISGWNIEKAPSPLGTKGPRALDSPSGRAVSEAD